LSHLAEKPESQSEPGKKKWEFNQDFSPGIGVVLGGSKTNQGGRLVFGLMGIYSFYQAPIKVRSMTKAKRNTGR
jgi:hypothetical protein